MAKLPARIEAHYTQGVLWERILGFLDGAGIDPDKFECEDLTPID